MAQNTNNCAAERRAVYNDMNFIDFNDVQIVKDPVFDYHRFYKLSKVPIVIDSGSYKCRAGWASEPLPMLNFRNLLGRTRKDRTKKDQESQMLVGNDITNLESMRLQLRNQFDHNVVIQYEYQKYIFDYIWLHLGIDVGQPIQHPIILTEAFLNLNYCRKNMTKLLFESYDIPGVVYGVDSLFIAHDQLLDNSSKSMVIVHLGNTTIHLIPVLRGQILFDKSRRINVGGLDIVKFLHKLLQLKYPMHSSSITLARCEELLFKHCRVAFDYKEEIDKWTNADYYNQNVLKIQLPFHSTMSSSTLTVEQQKEKKKEHGKRLREINIQRRDEKLVEDERRLQHLQYISELFNNGDETLFEDEMDEIGLESFDDLSKEIALLSSKIFKIKQKIHAADGPLMAALNRENKIIKLSSTKSIFAIDSYDSTKSLVDDVKRKKDEVLKNKHARKQRKIDMAKRGTAAAQERMRIISQLAKKEKGNDDFGSRDEDWELYKKISKDAGDSDSELENDTLAQCDDILRQYDPAYQPEEKQTQAENYQLHLGIEQFRAIELIFCPSMIGNDECGLIHGLENVLKQFSDDDQLLLVSDIFITGGCAQFVGLYDRIVQEVRTIRPFQSHYAVRVDPDPVLGAWKAANKWAMCSDNVQKCLVTREDFLQYGAEFFKQSLISNPYFPRPF